jgi:hypothetical protein
MLPIKQQGDTLLRRLVSEWASAMFSFPSYCAYETKTYYGQTIVDMPSAVALCNRPLTPIGENHPNMVKPSSRRSDSYLALQEAFDQTKPQLHGPDDKIQTALRSGPGQPKPKPAQTESLAARTIHLSDEIVGWQNKQAVYAPHSVAERDQFLKEIADYHQLFDSKVNAAVVELETCQVDAAKIKAEGTWVTDSAHSLIGTLGVAMAIKAAANAIPEGQPKCGTGQPTKGFGIQQNGQYWLTVGLSSLGPYKSDLQKGRSSAVGHKLGDYSSSISFYLQGDVLCVDATIFRAPNVPLLDVICNKVNAPPGWDTNFTEKAVEVVTEQEIPMFQIIFADDHHVRVNGVIPSGMNRYIVYSPEGATKITIDPTNPSPVNINIKRLFEYPAWQHRGEYAK